MHYMVKFKSLARRYGVIIPLTLLIGAIIGGLSYLMSMVGITRESALDPPAQPITAEAPLFETPAQRFHPVDPAIIAYLDFSLPSYGVPMPDVLAAGLEPIGAYLPRTGITQFELTGPTPLPTPLPYPTSPPLPTETEAVPEDEPADEADDTDDEPGLIPPTAALFTDEGVPPVMPYEIPEDTYCAPAGRPVQGILTQRFHFYHIGIDIGVDPGTPVRATHSGEVIYAGWSDIGYGNVVILQSGPYITYYAHNTSFNVRVGDLVGRNSIIAWSGNTGNSTGPHVHYETRINDIPVDPLTFENRGYPTC
jgi:murein DD-endopeptidase MepM/ murein hydrolase activator NlpD